MIPKATSIFYWEVVSYQMSLIIDTNTIQNPPQAMIDSWFPAARDSWDLLPEGIVT